MRLTVADGQRHGGVPGAGVVLDASGLRGSLIRVEHPYTKIEWLEITNFTARNRAIEMDNRPSSSYSTLSHLLIHDFNAGRRTAIRVRSDYVQIHNSMIFSGTGDGIQLRGDGAAILNRDPQYDFRWKRGSGFRARRSGLVLRVQHVLEREGLRSRCSPGAPPLPAREPGGSVCLGCVRGDGSPPAIERARRSRNRTHPGGCLEPYDRYRWRDPRNALGSRGGPDPGRRSARGGLLRWRG
jgi:hypothetical protein